jgi:hypothetical protein
VDITSSAMDDYTDGALTVFLECCEEEGEFMNKTCAEGVRFGAPSTEIFLEISEGLQRFTVSADLLHTRL